MTMRLPDGPPSATAHLYLREEQIRQSYEALMLAWRSLNSECETLLRENGLGSAHHRILFLVAAHPGINPCALLRCRVINKPFLGKTLRYRSDPILLVQEEDRDDRLKRPLNLTPEVESRARQLFQLLRDVMTRAYSEAGVTAVEVFKRVLSPLQIAPGGGFR